ncbi:hypothetical protein SCUCBS95973_006292 [Sporothrix curviconia]|uniref:Clr5 domain-containing protein n=1 Tax=Sporothrix curviconia TaxID=1260050 RepID=A0ABP0C6E5_9PEZI
MHYPYDSVADSHIGHTSSAPSYDMNGYSYQASPRDSGLATTMDEYSFNSYPTTAPPVEGSTTTPPMYSFSGPVNGHSAYMSPVNRLPPPNPGYSSYPLPMPHSPSLEQPGALQRTSTYRAGRSPDDGLDRTPQMPPMATGQHRLSSTDAAAERIRTPRTQPPQLGGMPSAVNGHHSGKPPAGAAMESHPEDFEATIPEENQNKVLAKGDEIDLNDDCNAEDRLIYDLHKKHRNHRGKGMWDTISAEYHKEAYSAMVRVYIDEEKIKYTRYAARLKEVIGTKYHDFKAVDVEGFLSRTGIEDYVPEQSSKTRKRNHFQARKLKGSDAGIPPSQPVAAVWNPGYGAPSIAGQQQYSLPDPDQPMSIVQYNYDRQALAAIPTPSLSQEQTNAFLDSLDEKYGEIDSDDALDSNYSDSPGDHKMSGTPEAGVSHRPLPSPSYNYATTRTRSAYK